MTNPFKRGAQTLFKHSRGWLKLLSRRARYQESAEAVSLIVSALLIGLLAGLAAVAFDRIVYWMGFGVTWLRGDLVGFGGAVVAGGARPRRRWLYHHAYRGKMVPRCARLGHP